MEGGEQITAISAPQGDAGRRRGLSLRHRTACSWSFASDRLCGLGGAASKKRGLRRPPGPPPGWPGVCGPRGGVSKSPRFQRRRGAAGKPGGPSLRPAQPVAGPSPPAASASRPAPLRKSAGLAAPRATAWVARGVWPPWRGEQITAISATQGGCGQVGRPQPPACTACSWAFTSGRLYVPARTASKRRGLDRPRGHRLGGPRGVWPRGHTPPGHTPPGRRVPPRCRMRTGSRSGFSGRQGRRTGSCSLCHTKKRAALGLPAGGRLWGYPPADGFGATR